MTSGMRERALLRQSKKGQGETNDVIRQVQGDTNDLLKELIQQQDRTNDLLEQLLDALTVPDPE